MPELTEYQVDWINKEGAKPITDETILGFDSKTLAREEALTLVESKLATSKDSIKEAQNFSITLKDNKPLFEYMWAVVCGKTTKKTMKWHAGSEDIGYFGYDILPDLEVDTTHDVPGSEMLEDDILRKLQTSLEKILELQKNMLEKLDTNGDRVFSDEDIRKELWTPLVRDGTIPENMVPDRFSEQAMAFKGASELYEKTLEKHTKSSTGKEGLLETIKQVKDFASFATTVVGQGMIIKDAKELNDLDTKYLEDNLTDEESRRRLKLQTEQAYVTLGSTLINGGFELGYEAVSEHSKGDKANWAGYVDKSLKVLANVAAAAITPIKNSHLLNTDDESETAMIKTVSATIAASIQASISGVRMAPILISAFNETDKEKRRQLIQNAIDAFADGVKHCFVTISTKYGADKQKQGDLVIAGSAIAAAIKTLSKADLALKAFEEGNPAEAAVRMGAGALQTVLSGFSELIVNATLSRDVSQEEYNSKSTFERLGVVVTGETAELLQDKKVGSVIDTLEKQMDTIVSKATELVGSEMPKLDEEVDGLLDFTNDMQKQLTEQDRKKAEEELTKAFGDERAREKMFESFDEKMVGYDDIYKETEPLTDIEGKPPSEVEESIKQIEAAIKRTAELRSRAELINGITSAGTAILASLIPGGGAVVAAQKVAYDVYMLAKSVEAHNKWCENIKIAYRSSSAYGTAIENMMKNARIHLNYDCVKLVLDSLKLGSEIARLADPTGISTIVSASASIGAALQEYGYKKYTERAIAKGWEAYVTARKNPSDRKNARKALRLNTTLSKHCIAYGAVVAKDPSAQAAITSCGVNATILADDTDVCLALVKFLENELNRDPVILQVGKAPKDWQPGRPKLTMFSWIETKTAATIKADPKLSPDSAKTPNMDKLLADLGGYWEGKESHAEWSKASNATKDKIDVVRNVKETLQEIQIQMTSYAPKGVDKRGHSDMEDIAKTFSALARLNIITTEEDIDGYNERKLPSEKNSLVVVDEEEVAADGAAEVEITATIKDSYGIVVEGKEVTFDVTGVNNTVTPPKANTDISGVATAVFTTTTAEKKDILIKVDDITINKKVVVVAKAGDGSKDHSTFSVSRESVTADDSLVEVTIELQDKGHNPIAEKAVTIVVDGTDNTINQPKDTSDKGITKGSFSTTKAEKKTVSITVDGVKLEKEVVAKAGNVSNDHSTLSVSDESVTADDTLVEVTIELKDKESNPIAEKAVTIVVDGTENTINQPEDTDDKGITKGSFSTTKAEKKNVSVTVDGVKLEKEVVAVP